MKNQAPSGSRVHAIPSGHRCGSEFRMKKPGAFRRSLLFVCPGQLKSGLAARQSKRSCHLRGGFFILSDPGAIRTRGRLLRRQMLYPAELRDRGGKNKAGFQCKVSGWTFYTHLTRHYLKTPIGSGL